MAGSLPISPGIFGAIIVGLSAALFTANPWLTFYSLLALIAVVILAWRTGEPPVIALVLVLQWLQAAMVVFQSDVYGLPLTEMEDFPASVEQAVILSLVGVIVVAAGFRIAVGPRSEASGPGRRHLVSMYSAEKLFYAFGVAVVAVAAMKIIAHLVPGLAQQLLAFSSVESVVLYLLAYTVFQSRRGFVLLMLALLLVVGSGLFAGFASWKEPIFIVSIAYLTVYPKLNVRTLLKVTPIFLLLLYLAVTWTLVKKEVRAAGPDQSLTDRGSHVLQMLGSGLDRENFVEGLDGLAERVAYVLYFAKAIEHVPALVPHEDGALWGRAFSHVFQPRIFFPNKEPLVSDSVITYQFTGDMVSGAQGEWTSIGMGYFAESYVDYGAFGMFLPIFVLGIMVGLIYRYFLRYGRERLMVYGILTAIFVSTFKGIETSNVKIVGGILMPFIVLALAERFGGRFFWRYTTIRMTRNTPRVSAPVR